MAQKLAKEYDVVVCGAGPAGLNAAYTLCSVSDGQCRVAILDKKEPWREPVSCAEAVSKKALEQFWPSNEAWIRQHLDGVYFTSPDGTKVDFTEDDCGYILNRALFHREMAEKVEKKGAFCHFSAECKSLFRDSEGFWNVDVCIDGVISSVRAPVIVDATGPGAKLTHGVPLLETLEAGDTDLEPAIFAIVENVEHNPKHIELLFGNKYFPGGYGWVFPRDSKTVNIGLVNGRKFLKTHSPRVMLQQFLAKYYPSAVVKSIHGGAIACGQSLKPIAVAGFFKSGDAASCVNPISRSGIVEALDSGHIVGECAWKWLNANSATEKESIEAETYARWMKAQGNTHLRLSKAKVAFSSIQDCHFDKAAHKLARIPQKNRTLFRIFFTVLCTSPSLLWKMRSFVYVR